MNQKEIITELCRNYVQDKIDHFPDDKQTEQKEAEVMRLVNYLTNNI